MTEWVLILAAGESRRFNGIKALAQWEEGTLLSKALETARTTHSAIMVVTGAHHDEIITALKDNPSVFNPDWQDGMGRSLATGVKAIMDRDGAASLITILPVDQPFITLDHLTALKKAAKQSGQCVLTSSDDVIGPPATIPQSFFTHILQLKAGKGLKSILKPDQYQTVSSAAALHDIDTRADLLHYSQLQRAALNTAT